SAAPDMGPDMLGEIVPPDALMVGAIAVRGGLVSLQLSPLTETLGVFRRSAHAKVLYEGSGKGAVCHKQFPGEEDRIPVRRAAGIEYVQHVIGGLCQPSFGGL